ncbi:MAG TPA: PAS domain S-box protein [Methanothrix sp.]|nr:PAS domain S-box protein [Methanothrix sp.]HPT19190.1 PAS domain S-box protein [Methanothrix sp.]
MDIKFETVGRCREENDLRASEESYRELMESLNEVVFACDMQSIITYISPPIKALSCYDPGEMIGKTFIDLAHPEDRAALRRKLKECSQGICEPFEFRIIDRSGQTKHLMCSCRLSIVDGRPAGFIGLVADNTSKKMAEISLCESERRYRQFVETANEGIWSMDSSYMTVFVNSKMAEMLGYTVPEMIGKNVTYFMFSADLHQHDQRMEKRRMGHSQTYEHRFRRKDGSACWTIVSATSLQDDQGKFLGSFAMFTDITRRKQAEKSLAASERKFAAAFQIGPDPVAITDAVSGVIIDANKSFERWSGFCREDLIGKDVNDLRIWVYPSDRNEILNILRKGEAIIDMPVRLRKKNGTISCMQFSASLVKLKEGIYLLERSHDITAERTAKEDLLQSEERLHLALDAARMTTWEWDIQSERTVRRKDREGSTTIDRPPISAVSGSGEDVIISSASGRLDLWFDQVIHGDDRGKVNRTIREAIKNVSDYYLEFRTIPSPGTVCWIASKGHVFADEDGRPSRIIGIDWDITQREKAREALIESQNRLVEIIDFLPDATLVIDREGRVIAWNKAIEKLTGVKAENMIGKGNYEYALPFYGERRPILIDLVLKSSLDVERCYDNISWLDERTLTGEAYMPCLGSGETFLMGNSSILYDSHGDVAGAIESIRDITDRKHMEEDLKMAEVKYRNIVEDMPNMLCRFRSDGILNYVNDEYCRYFGKSRESLIGSSFMPLIPDEDLPMVREKMASLSLANPVVSYEHRVIHESGQLRWHRWTDRAIFDDDGNLVEYQSIGEDITDIVSSKEALILAKDAALAAARAKSEFLANMSHEIRTPLNAIIGMTDVLLDTDITLSQRNTVDIIRNGGNLLATLINDILDFSKIEAGKKEISSHPFLLKSSLESSLEIVAGKAKENGIGLSFLVAGDVPKWIVGDANSLRQVLINLLSNAAKFTEKGSIELSVQRESEGMAGGADGSGGPCSHSGMDEDLMLHFSVRDTGTGIPEDRMDSLFKSFSQVDGSLTRKYGGTGLGLAISKRLVELMGGRIWAESELGKGSAFHFTIATRAASGNVEARGEEQKLPEYDLKRVDLSRVSCLIAEDNIINQKVALHMLAKLGLSADVAVNGLEVLRALESKPYDLIFMDVAMPEMDGFEASRTIRKLPQGDGIYIIALTAHSLDGDMEKCLASGMDDYISKPIRIDALAASLKNFLSKKETQRS